ncbi:hypothetical protein [Actinomadura parmotrematis]|uniref:ESX secretion-associated protein EspG n=1 Tax=Actinomadura parmotrematis TaxID=2864039 RepID=A0ABS7FVP6_9ACTN|nr:hypothetical protein [Actinomadura parmotrematis]MBW8484504.1 hypothetical protein [Actinomadura parmotrematis]
MTTDTGTDHATSVLRDVLRVYDHRFLDLDPSQRRRLFEGTRQVLGADGLSDEARAALPASYRLRAFCIQHGMAGELERLIADEVSGSPAGAVVVGGRVYAMYPYLRGVPRQDADITDEVGVEHRLDAVAWQGRRELRIRGTARLERIETHRTAVDLLLRERATGAEHRVAAEAVEDVQDGFEAVADLAGLGPGRWDAHVAATALGLTREARFGTLRGPRLKTETQTRALEDGAEASAYFTKGGHLAVLVRGEPRPDPLRAKIKRRLHR